MNELLSHKPDERHRNQKVINKLINCEQGLTLNSLYAFTLGKLKTLIIYFLKYYTPIVLILHHAHDTQSKNSSHSQQKYV